MCEKLSLLLGDCADKEQTFFTKLLCFQIALVLFVTIFSFSLGPVYGLSIEGLQSRRNTDERPNRIRDQEE